MDPVEEIKLRLDITEYIGRHVNLKKSGRNFKGLCPFHQEKTPSFYVFPESQTWHCFGCDRGGDIYSFLMEFNGLNFRAALEELARAAGVELKPRTPEELEAESEADRLRRVMEMAADYYHTLLLTSPQARDARAYLKKRGFTRETLETFKLGYSLNEWHAIRSYLLDKDVSLEEQVLAGLIVQKESGTTYDRFRNRVMIPIHDRRGRVIAFGGRVLSAEDQPKYMNSPQTPIFDKSQVLFGYHLASRAIREADEAVIVEGYMDVMIPHQAGFANIVAPMGTALSEAHLKLLQRLTRRFVLALDPDAAGISATLRGLETARETLDREWQPVFDPRGLVGYEGRLKAEIRAVMLPQGLDPDELILDDPKRWGSLIAQSQPIVRFYFEQLLQQENPNEPKGKARIIDAMLPLLRDIADSVEREAYIQEIALKLGLDAQTLMDRLRARERAEAIRRQAAVAPQRPALRAADADIEAHLLATLMRTPELLSRVDMHLTEHQLEPITTNDFATNCRYIWSAWLEISEHPEMDLTDLLPPEQIARVQTWVSTPPPDFTMEQLERDVIYTVLRVRQRHLREKHRQLNTLIIEAQNEGDVIGQRHAQSMLSLARQIRSIQQALSDYTPSQKKKERL